MKYLITNKYGHDTNNGGQHYGYVFYSLKRGGQHAIILWIAKQMHRKVLFINNAMGDPYKTPIWEHGRQYPDFVNAIKSRRDTKRFKSTRKYGLFTNYEDAHIKQISNNINRFIGPTNIMKNIIILRDPFNLAASRERRGIPEHRHNYIDLWKTHAKEYLDITKYLNNKYKINFNSWVSDINYRKKVSNDLCDIWNDDGLNFVSKFGRGSSFDGRNKAGQELKVLERWKLYKNLSWFMDKFDDETHYLSKLIFGGII
ncbi:MAG: hypothetical protein GF411_14190 [Candidatus Lokiarchaeota archaeon]|nr:hypothetical protein [Candidatus Lokiarchaeota archaeon]